MADPRAKALALITRAAHPSTGEEEARTSAVLGARLIAQHGLLDAEGAEEQSARAELEGHLNSARAYLQSASAELQRLNRQLEALRRERDTIREYSARKDGEITALRMQLLTAARALEAREAQLQAALAAAPAAFQDPPVRTRKKASPQVKATHARSDETPSRASEASGQPRTRRKITRRSAFRRVPRIIDCSTYDGTCKGCGRTYGEGDRIAWVRGEGATHAACAVYWEGEDDGEDEDDDVAGDVFG